MGGGGNQGFAQEGVEPEGPYILQSRPVMRRRENVGPEGAGSSPILSITKDGWLLYCPVGETDRPVEEDLVNQCHPLRHKSWLTC